MRFMQWAKDGGPESTVDGFYIIELKWLFTIVLLRFGNGTRDAYHSHAFNAITWFLKGLALERTSEGRMTFLFPRLCPKWTPRDCVHKVHSSGTTWALSFRGSWKKTWHELRGPEQKRVDLAHGRAELSTEQT